MTDILERLDGLVATCGCGACEDAAAEIRRLRAALEPFTKYASFDPPPGEDKKKWFDAVMAARGLLHRTVEQ
jgi:hypothetical protein